MHEEVFEEDSSHFGPSEHRETVYEEEDTFVGRPSTQKHHHEKEQDIDQNETDNPGTFISEDNKSCKYP